MAAPRVIDHLSPAGAGPFVLLAGAGISLWHPSSLPTWGQFNTALLDEAKARGRRALPKQSPLHRELDALTVDNIGSKAFSNALVEMLAGDSYFSVVGALAKIEPNDAHRAIARLVSRGVLAAIVTTNFDTLIERALEDEGLRADVYSEPADYRRPARTGVPVHKIHGSATEQTGLIDTVGQKLRGLAPVVRAHLRDVFTEYPVIALGYSGGDLDFGADYLALRAVPPGSDRIWWVVRPEDRTHLEPSAQAIVSQRGAFVAMSQAAALEALGAGRVALDFNDDSRRERLASFRGEASALFKRQGALNTLAFCMRLMAAAGHAEAAAAMWTLIASEIEGRRRQTVAMVGPAMRALAAEGHRLFGVAEQERWACRQLTDIRRRRENPKTARRGSEADLIRDIRSEALACLTIGDARVRRGDDEVAGLAMQRTMDCCEYLGDITLLPGVFRLYGWREAVRLRDTLAAQRPLRKASTEDIEDLIRREDTALTFLTAAEATALVGGNVDAIESARLRAELFVELGEYDAAALCFDRLLERVGFGVHRETEVRIAVTLGEIDMRQGLIDQAMDRWNTCLAGSARGNPMLEAHVRSTIVGCAGYSPAWRPTVVAHCNDLLERMSRRELPEDGRSDLVCTRSYLEAAREGLTAAGSAALDPLFLQHVDRSASQKEFDRWPAYYVRQDLIVSEFFGESGAVLERLDSLVAEQFCAGLASRALAAATAHVRRAGRDGDEEQRFAADVNVAAIRRWLGDTEAERWFVDALQSSRAQDPQVRSGLEQRVPHVLWSTRWTATSLNDRSVLLDLDDALALRWTPPPTGEERERAATVRFAQNDFVMGRVLALQAAASFREEGDPGGLARALGLLRDAGARDKRSNDDIYSLCFQA